MYTHKKVITSMHCHHIQYKPILGGTFGPWFFECGSGAKCPPYLNFGLRRARVTNFLILYTIKYAFKRD